MDKEGVLDWAWIFIKRAREAKMDDEQIRWVVDETLNRFDSFDVLTRESVNRIGLEVE